VFGSSRDKIFKTSVGVYKIGPPKGYGYKGKTAVQNTVERYMTKKSRKNAEQYIYEVSTVL
jgi:hypothetical protein